MEIARRVPDGDATTRFFLQRPDELDNKNSTCYLMDDGTTLLRVVTIFKKGGDNFINGTTIVILNLQTGEVRDVSVKIGLRADVHKAAMVDGNLLLYLTYTAGGGLMASWKQCLFRIDDQQMIDLHPENRQPDSVTMGWDPHRNMMVDLPGFAADPQPLNQDSQVCIEIVGKGKRSIGKLRYGDSSGKPNLFKSGLSTFAW